MSANYSFMFHAILLLPLILVLALLKQPTAEEVAANNVKAPSRVPEDGPMPKYAIFTAVMFAIVFFAFYTVLLNMSSICANENIGGRDRLPECFSPCTPLVTASAASCSSP